MRPGTGTGTQIRNSRDLGPGPKIEKSGIADWDRDSDFRDEGFQASTLGNCSETKEFRDVVPGTEKFPGHGPGPVPTPVFRMESRF